MSCAVSTERLRKACVLRHEEHNWRSSYNEIGLCLLCGRNSLSNTSQVNRVFEITELVAVILLEVFVFSAI